MTLDASENVVLEGKVKMSGGKVETAVSYRKEMGGWQ